MAKRDRAKQADTNGGDQGSLQEPAGGVKAEASAAFDIPSPRSSDLQPDQKAVREDVAYTSSLDIRTRETNNRINRLTRDDKFQDFIYLCMRLIIFTSVLLFVCAITTLVAHFVLPDEGSNFILTRWLDSESVERLQDFLFSGVVGAALAGGLNKLTGNKDETE